MEQELIKRIVTQPGKEGAKQKKMADWIFEIEKIQNQLNQAFQYQIAKRHSVFEQLLDVKTSGILEIQQ